MEESEVSLDKEVNKYRQAAHAESTKTVYKCQLKRYISFCDKYSYQPVPVSSKVLCRYAAYLADTMRPASIKQYLNVIRILHLENGFKNPLQGDYYLKTVLKGVERIKGNFVSRKMPITVGILLSFLTVLDLNNSQHLAFWSASLVAFYGMLRKSSLFPRGSCGNHMCLSNCILEEWGIKIVLSYSKTIQCQERRVYIALPWNRKDSRLCPVTTLLRALKLSGCCQACDYVFSYIQNGEKYRMTYELFTSMLKSVLGRLKLPILEYSGHSYRRDGATHALQAGVPSEVICAQGDWRSLAYLDYIDQVAEKDRAEFVQMMYT
jgi:hypothetical protein